ncbi:AAA family ATPase [Paenibacillus ginsengarvi]|uniref:Bacterial transcriptional activator domain-containing protein n=1 Tax=Paenibacillus ginsengarvi TaxID=400777 RepID=A0A3B0C054_9BACL|nr:AAA family ATPase [Paenibacillus ginsengarvi]RKN77056.1 hypothetical protein D7M11_23825 [Paenibacillus ginsengarvi]
MAGYSFQLLGSLNIALGVTPVTNIPGKKAALLLAYLILAADRPQSRRRIAFDFWPDSSEKQALSNLRKLLHDLRAGVPELDRFIRITPAYMQWNPELPCDSDVRAFERAAQGNTLYELRQAEELYRGELLPGFYEEWIEAKREELLQIYRNVLDKLTALLENRRDYEAALLFANKRLSEHPFREETYRLLMRLHGCRKDMAGVAQTYDRLSRVLETELGIAPSAETQQLYSSLMRSGDDLTEAAYSRKPLIGRIGEWGALLDLWQQAKTGTTSMLLLKGEAGIGKTRLALEFKAWAESQGIRTAWAGCYPTVRSLSYTPVTSWLRSIPLPPLSPVWLSELTRLLPELFETFPELPPPAPIRENWQLNKWYEAIERMLLAEQPLLLGLDDLQWCDKETLQFLAYMLRGGSKAKLFVIATMRTCEYANEAVDNFVAGLRLAGNIAEIELAPLTEEHTGRLMAAIVGAPLAELHAPGVHAETGGNPLFIVETMREWQAGKSSSEFCLSPLVKSVIESRLSRLPSASLQLVSVAAAVGKPVTPELLAIVSGMGEETVLGLMEQLTQLKIIREYEDRQYGFTHDTIRSVAYQAGNGSRRKIYHRQIANGLITYHQGWLEPAAAEIAYHFELAGMNAEAAAHYELAAAAAERLYANETRINYYRKLCELLPSDRILPYLMKLGEAWIVVGNWIEAEKSYRQWLERSGGSATIRERSLCDVALGNCLRQQGKYEEARGFLERALRCFELTEDASGVIFTYTTLGLLHYYMGSYDQTLECLRKRMELAGQQSRDDCRLFGVVGHLLYDQCRYDEAVYWIKKQIAIAAGYGDHYTTEQAMGLLALIDMDTDEMDRALAFLADKLELSRSIGDRMGFANGIGMLGRYYWYLGHDERALACIAFCLGEAVAIQDWRVAAIMLSYGGRCLLTRQRLDEADRWLDLSIRLFHKLRTPYFECETLYYASLLRESQDRQESAAEIAEQALQIANRLQRKDMAVSLQVLLAQLESGLGRLSPAEAINRLEALAGLYPDPREQAAIRYAMWKLDPELQKHDGAAARQLNEELYRKSGKRVYADRCRELGSYCTVSAAPPPMPSLAAEAVQAAGGSPRLPEDIELYLNR